MAWSKCLVWPIESESNLQSANPHLPASMSKQALHWWCHNPIIESSLRDSPGTFWTFSGAPKPSSQQFNLSLYFKVLNNSVNCRFECSVTGSNSLSGHAKLWSFFAHNHGEQRKITMISTTTLLLKDPVCYSDSTNMTEWSPALSTSTCVNERIPKMMLTGAHVAVLNCSINCFCLFVSSWDSGVYANWHHKN